MALRDGLKRRIVYFHGWYSSDTFHPFSDLHNCFLINFFSLSNALSIQLRRIMSLPDLATIGGSLLFTYLTACTYQHSLVRSSNIMPYLSTTYALLQLPRVSQCHSVVMWSSLSLAHDFIFWLDCYCNIAFKQTLIPEVSKFSYMFLEVSTAFLVPRPLCVT